MKLIPVTAREIPVEQAIFNRAWGIVKEYGNISNSDIEAWDDLVGAVDSLYWLGTDEATYRLSKALALGIVDYLETKSGKGGH